MSEVEIISKSVLLNLINTLIIVSPVFAVSIILGATYYFVLKVGGKTALHVGEVISASIGFGVLALSVGILMALSRESAVGTIVPAALTLIGGVAIYVVNNEQGRPPVVLSAIVSFGLMFLFGAMVGGDLRTLAEDSQVISKYDLDAQRAKAELEFQINTERNFRGLPPIDFSDN